MAIVLVPYPLLPALLTPDQRWAMNVTHKLGWVFGASLVATAVLTFTHDSIRHGLAVKKIDSKDFRKEQKGEEKNTTLRVLGILSCLGWATCVGTFAGFFYCNYVFHKLQTCNTTKDIII